MLNNRWHISVPGCIKLLFALTLTASMLAACGSVEPAPTEVPVLVEETLIPTQTIVTTPQGEPEVTSITIDGQADDWQGREIITDDPIGDAEAGFLDFGNGYAFINQDALYFLVEIADAEAEFQLFDMQFVVGSSFLQITWSPGQYGLSISYLSSGVPGNFGYATNSSFAYGPNLEGRIALTDLKSPDPQDVNIGVIMAMSGEGGPWRAVDEWKPSGTLPMVYEKDPPILASMEREYVLTRAFNLPEGYLADELVSAPYPGGGVITQSESGVIYLKSSDSVPGRISVYDPASNTVEKVMELPDKIGIGRIFGGPEDSAFVTIGGSVIQIYPDGYTENWGFAHNGTPQAMTKDGRLIGFTENGNELLEFYPDDNVRVIAGGFAYGFTVSPTANNAYIVHDLGKGEIVEVQEDGSKRVILDGLPYGETYESAIGPNGDYFLNRLDRILQINPETTAVTEHRNILPGCEIQAQSFTFIDEFKTLATGGGLVTADLEAAENAVILEGKTYTFASDIGPDDAFYYGMPGCNQAEGTSIIYRVRDDEEREVVLDGIPGRINDIAFGPQGSLYVYLFAEGKPTVLYFKDLEDTGTPVPLPANLYFQTIAVHPQTGNLFIGDRFAGTIWEITPEGTATSTALDQPYDINGFHIDFAPDGQLYGMGSEDWGGKEQVNRWVFRIDLEDGSQELVGVVTKEYPGGVYGGVTM